MEIAGKYSALASEAFNSGAGNPRKGFVEGQKGLSLGRYGGNAALMDAHPQVAFGSQSLGFSPAS